jgi:hypothetical protein
MNKLEPFTYEHSKYPDGISRGRPKPEPGVHIDPGNPLCAMARIWKLSDFASRISNGEFNMKEEEKAAVKFFGSTSAFASSLAAELRHHSAWGDMHIDSLTKHLNADLGVRLMQSVS